MPKVSQSVDSGSYVSQSSTLISRECLNLYPTNPMAEGGVARGGLASMPGSVSFAAIPENIVSQFVFNSSLYAIGRTGTTATIYKVASDGTYADMGSITGAGGGTIVVDNNGVNACLVIESVNKSYFYDDATGPVQITDTVFQGYESENGGIRSVTFIDGYYVFNTYESLFISSLVTNNDGKSFDALDFVKPFLREKAQKVMSVRGELMLFGQDTSKFYSNVGGSDFPFAEIPGATIQKGIEGELNALEFDNAYFFVGSGNGERQAVWKGVGGGAVAKISTDFVDSLIDSGDVNLGSFMLDGRPFFCVQDQDITFCYDILSSSIKGLPVWVKWARDSTSSPVSFFGGMVEAYNKIFLPASRLGVASLDTSIGGQFKDFGSGGETEASNFVFSGAYLQNQSDGLFINRLELVMETGIGNDPETSITDTDPEVLMEFSDDGARTWKACGTRKIGKYQQYNRRLVWNRIGAAPNSRIFRFTCNTSLAVHFNRVDIDLTGGARNG